MGFLIKSLENKAREFAEKMHEGQYRMDGTTPYIEHPRGVAGLLKENGIYDENILCAAWLHDTIEDCNIPAESLKREFNPEVARIVSFLTRDVGREEYLDRIRNADYSVQIIKLADVVHNSSTLFPGIGKETVERLVTDSKNLYLGLARKIAPRFYTMILENLMPWADLE